MKPARLGIDASSVTGCEPLRTTTSAVFTEGGVLAKLTAGPAIHWIGRRIEAAEPTVHHLFGTRALPRHAFKAGRTDICTTATVPRIRLEIETSLTTLSLPVLTSRWRFACAVYAHFIALALVVAARTRHFAYAVYAYFIFDAFYVATKACSLASAIDTLFLIGAIRPAPATVSARRLEVGTNGSALGLAFLTAKAPAALADFSLVAFLSTRAAVLRIRAQIDALSSPLPGTKHVCALGVLGLAAPREDQKKDADELATHVPVLAKR